MAKQQQKRLQKPPKEKDEFAQAAANPSEVRKAVSAKTLKDLLRRSNERRDAIGEISGAQSEEVRAIIERYGTNRQALRLIMSLAGKKPEQLRNFIDDFDHLWDISGLKDKADSAPSLGLEQPGEEDGEAEEAGETEEPGNVSRPKFGQAAE